MPKITSIIFILVSFFSNAQIVSEKRVEYDLSEGRSILSVFSLGNRGLITLDLERIKGDVDNFIISKYDTDLNVIGSLTIEREARIKEEGIFPNLDTSRIFLLFSNKTEWIVKEIEIGSFTIKETRFGKEKNDFKMLGSLANAYDGKLYFRGVSARKPALKILDLNNGNEYISEIPGENAKREIESFGVSEDYKRIVIFQRDGRDFKTAPMTLLTASFSGEFSTPLVLDRDPQFSVIDGTVKWQSDGTIFIAGTYGIRNSVAATGYYLTKYENGVQSFIKYHSFSEFDNFFSYLPQKIQARVEKRKNKKSARGATDFVKTLVTIHPIIVGDDMYRIVGEVFHATYRTESYQTMGANGRMTTSTRQVFDGYQYTHAAILDMTQNGDKIKDYCFAMYSFYKPYSVTRFLKIKAEKSGEMHFIFATGRSIKAASISKNHELSETDFGEVKADNENEKVISDAYSYSIYWYGNNYLLKGTRRFKNTDDESPKKKHTIGYLTKISYQPPW